MPAVPRPGNFHLDHANGGVALHRMVRTGGVESIFNAHMPKKELYYMMQAYIAGITLGKELE